MRPILLLLVPLALAACGPSDSGSPDANEPVSGFVAVDGGRIFYEMHHADAPGVPVLLIHGGPGMTSCYFGLLDERITDRPVIRYDQLGTGLSDRPADSSYWNLPHFVSEIDRLRDALGLEEVHLVGSSWGGAVATEYALTTEREGLRSLILAGPLLSTERWLADADTLVELLPPDLRDVIREHEAAGTFDDPTYLAATDSFYARFLYRGQPPEEVPECEGVEGNAAMYNTMWGPSEFTATGTLLEYDRTDRLHELDLPVLLVGGEFDEARPVTLRAFAELMPNAEVVILEDAAHFSMVDQPDAFAAAIERFMSSLER